LISSTQLFQSKIFSLGKSTRCNN